MKIEEILKAYQIDISDIPLIEYNNMFLVNRLWLKRGVENDISSWDLVVRELPDKWSFYVTSGIDRLIAMILSFRFDERAVQILKDSKFIIDKKAEDYYRNFKFTGDIYAMKDGTIFFPGEPIVRIVAPIGEANLLTAFMMNILSYPIRIFTKTLRIKLASEGKMFMAGSTVRLPGFEQGLWNTRDAFILGSPVYSPILYKKFPVYKSPGKVNGTINHAMIKSFVSEREAFSYVFDNILDDVGHLFIMVDTYDFKKGLNTFIEEVKKRPGMPSHKLLILLDSGDLSERAFYTKQTLSSAGINDVRINAMSNLDEYKIDEMIKNNVPIDSFFAGTEVANVTDNPKLEVVYKMAELIRPNGNIEYKAKLAVGKVSYPGRKQIFRVHNTEGQMIKDVVGLEDEKPLTNSEPMLEKFVENGKLIKTIPDLEEIRTHLDSQIETLPSIYKDLHKKTEFPVEASKKLTDLLEQVRKIHTDNT